jgi:hypothetical protein
MLGSTGLTNWTSDTVCGNLTAFTQRLQALHRAPLQQPTVSVVKPEGGPAASVKLGQESCVRSSGIIILLVRQPSDGLGCSPPQMRPQ